MRVKNHILRENHSNKLPNRYLILDTETRWTEVDGEKSHTLRLAWTVYIERTTEGVIRKEEWHLWTSARDICEYINGLSIEGKSLILLAHNCFFDLQIINWFKIMPEFGWKYSFHYDNGLTYILVIKRKKSSIKCLSTTNYFPHKLEDLGQMIGVQKIKVDYETVDTDTLTIYCFRDVEITLRLILFWLTFIHDNDLGAFAMSRAGQSMRAYRHKHMKEKLFFHNDTKLTELEREAYFGGRTEAFRIGRQKNDEYVILDVNSMYPYIMRYCPMPVRCADLNEGINPRRLYKLSEKYCVVAEVLVNTRKPRYACRINSKVCFPTGVFTAFLCTEGYRTAYSKGEVLKVGRYALYDRGYIFGSYVDEFYERKLQYKSEGNAILTTMAKLFLNSLYGKFGQTQPEEVIKADWDGTGYLRDSVYDIPNRCWHTTTYLFGKSIQEIGKKSSRTSMVAIPAHITEFGRLLLWEIIEQIGPRRVLYCDTDSVMIRKRDVKRLRHPIHSSQLGALSVQKTAPFAVVYGAKDYAFGDLIKIKGVPRSSIEIEPNVFQFEMFLSQKSHMRLGESERYITRTVRKTLSRKYDKGIVKKNGRVKPISCRAFRFPLLPPMQDQ